MICPCLSWPMLKQSTSFRCDQETGRGKVDSHHITGTRRATSELISRDFALCPTAVQKQEVTTTTSLIKTQGVLSMDAPTQAPSVKTRLGNKVQTAPASSTTSGFGPITKTSAGRNWHSVNDMTGYLRQLAVFFCQLLFMTMYIHVIKLLFYLEICTGDV